MGEDELLTDYERASSDLGDARQSDISGEDRVADSYRSLIRAINEIDDDEQTNDPDGEGLLNSMVTRLYTNESSSIRGTTSNMIYLDEANTFTTTGYSVPATTLSVNNDENITFGFNGGSNIKIDKEGNFELSDESTGTRQAFNIFDLVERIEKVEETMSRLLEQIPKKLTGRTLRSKSEI